MEHLLITTNPGIEGGKPIIKGTRITVEMLADEYAAGRSIELSSYKETTVWPYCAIITLTPGWLFRE